MRKRWFWVWWRSTEATFSNVKLEIARSLIRSRARRFRAQSSWIRSCRSRLVWEWNGWRWWMDGRGVAIWECGRSGYSPSTSATDYRLSWASIWWHWFYSRTQSMMMDVYGSWWWWKLSLWLTVTSHTMRNKISKGMFLYQVSLHFLRLEPLELNIKSTQSTLAAHLKWLAVLSLQILCSIRYNLCSAEATSHIFDYSFWDQHLGHAGINLLRYNSPKMTCIISKYSFEMHMWVACIPVGTHIHTLLSNPYRPNHVIYWWVLSALYTWVILQLSISCLRSNAGLLASPFSYGEDESYRAKSWA